MDLKKICESANPIILDVGKFIREQSLKVGDIEIVEKDFNSLVSYVDKEAENQLVSRLSGLIKDAGFITEEETENIEGKEWEWIIDPLDGTTNFLYGIPFFCVSVGLRRDEKPVLGAIYEINRDELFYAFENGGAFLNSKSISVSKRKTLKKSLLATGFPHNDFSRFEEYLKSFSYLMHNTRGLRRLGSAAADLAFVACGRFDGFFEYGLSPWDVAAGAVIIKEAGGVVMDFSGGENYLFGREMIAANPFIIAELQQRLNDDFE